MGALGLGRLTSPFYRWVHGGSGRGPFLDSTQCTQLGPGLSLLLHTASPGKAVYQSNGAETWRASESSGELVKAACWAPPQRLLCCRSLDSTEISAGLEVTPREGLGQVGGSAESKKGPVWPGGGKQAWKVMSGSREQRAPSPLRGGPLGVKVLQSGRELGWPPGSQRLEEPKPLREGLV